MVAGEEVPVVDIEMKDVVRMGKREGKTSLQLFIHEFHIYFQRKIKRNYFFHFHFVSHFGWKLLKGKAKLRSKQQ
ncbi:hypothetical protein L6452_02727 [Arctium lappa]|uniref:Uncharacterized protein n=1 Tax=Arctium lappa TaxID=4217 RepID=A0ACB9FKE1_ARCLA|nr:hypothetical protein L6452_02727 [Arctium lappa]